MIQPASKAKAISDFFKPLPPPPSKKICDVLSDVLRESVAGKMHRTVRGQVKNHSTLEKQGKCWVLTALIADHTSSVEVCFDSEVSGQNNQAGKWTIHFTDLSQICLAPGEVPWIYRAGVLAEEKARQVESPDKRRIAIGKVYIRVQ